MLSKQITQYLIDFLVGPLWLDTVEGERYPRRFEAIGYTSDPESMKNYPIVIIPSSFFDYSVYGTEQALPSLFSSGGVSPYSLVNLGRNGVKMDLSGSSMQTSSLQPISC